MLTNKLSSKNILAQTRIRIGCFLHDRVYLLLTRQYRNIVGRAGLMHTAWAALYSRYSLNYTADIHYVEALVVPLFAGLMEIMFQIRKVSTLYTGAVSTKYGIIFFGQNTFLSDSLLFTI